jgi:hypothetical protein
MSKWLEETHGIQFELLRHFLVRFFDSDLITAPGQATPAVIGAISIFMPWFAVMISPLKHKYAYLSSLESADVYLRAVRADQLWLITLMMSTIGLLTAIKWQSVFPGLRDYRALAALPLRSYQIFQAKLAALLIAATAAIFVLDLFPSVIFPMISGGRWALNPSFGVRVGVHTIVCAAGSYFFFFSFIALQGALLVLLKGRLFERVSGVLQSALVPLMLVFIVLSFSIEPKVTATVLHFTAGLVSWALPAHARRSRSGNASVGNQSCRSINRLNSSEPFDLRGLLSPAPYRAHRGPVSFPDEAAPRPARARFALPRSTPASGHSVHAEDSRGQ